MIASSRRLASASWKIRRRIAARSSSPLACSTPAPNASTTSRKPSDPFATALRAATSASATNTPKASKRRWTSLFPEATPPVSPTMNSLIPRLYAPPAPLLQEAEVPADEGVAPEEGDPAGDGEVGAEGDGGGAVAPAGRQPHRADDRAYQRGQQDGRQDALQADPGAERGEQLEVAVAHAFLAGELLEQPPHRPQAQVADDRADQRVLGRDVQGVDAGHQSQPHERQGELVRQQLRAQVDAGERDQEAGEHDRAEALPAEPEAPHATQHQQHRQQLDQRVLDRDRRLAGAAAPAQRQPAQHRDVLPPGELVLAVRAVRALDHDARWRRVVDLGLAEHLQAVALPLPLQPPGQAQDDDVEEAADQQAQACRHRIADFGVLVEECHLAARHRQIAAASLKIGRYMPTTMAPTMPPMKIMISGSSRLDSASTALLTSFS